MVLLVLFSLLTGCRGYAVPAATTAPSAPSAAIATTAPPPSPTFTDPYPTLYNQGPDDVLLYNAEVRPRYLRVTVGTKVTWTNLDWAVYGLYSDTMLFHATLYPFGGTYSFVFTEPGTYLYFIDPYTEMMGYVIVS